MFDFVRLDFCTILFDKIPRAFTLKAKTVAVIKTYLCAWDRYPVESDIHLETSGQQGIAKDVVNVKICLHNASEQEDRCCTSS